MRQSRAALALRKNVRRFRLRAAALIAVAGLIAWAAWLAPWNRRAPGIPVVIPDAPPAATQN